MRVGPATGRIAPPVGTRPLVLWEAFGREARELLGVFEGVDRKLAGRINLVRFIRTVAGRAPDGWEAALAALRADHAEMARAVLAQTRRDRGLLDRLSIALQRYDDAAAAARAIGAALERAQGLPTHLRMGALGEVDLPKLNGKIYLLANFDALFRADPVLNQLFPPIERMALLEAARPPAPSRPATPGVRRSGLLGEA